jgi:mRNA interferase MazF
MKNKPMELTLCTVCARQYYNSPEHNITRKSKTQRIKEHCDFCSVRTGFDYIITQKEKKGRN